MPSFCTALFQALHRLLLQRLMDMCCRASFEQMAQQAPKLLNLLQTIILRSTCLSVAHALEALERSGMD